MDWAFEMPLKTKYISSYEMEKIETKIGFLQEVTRPILVIFPGMCSDETEIYIQNTVRQAWKRGYQPLLIQYRGQSGIELTSPLTYGCG